MESSERRDIDDLNAVADEMKEKIKRAASPRDVQKTLLEAKLRMKGGAVSDLLFVELLISGMSELHSRNPDEDVSLSFKDEWVASITEVEPVAEDAEHAQQAGESFHYRSASA